MGHTRILVVEDSATQAEALRTTLVQRGFEVAVASSGEQALELLRRDRVSLVLSDIVMPGMSGYDLCRRIKELQEHSELPVVLLTSLTDPMDIVRGLECGADNYVTKPYDSEYLLARVRNVLDRQHLRGRAKASLGVNVNFLGASFTITSEREQILDLFISSIEDVVRTNSALQESQAKLAEAQRTLERYADSMAQRAQVSADKYATLMQQANDAILVLDARGSVLEANARALELLGRSLEQLRGQPLNSLAAPESQVALGAQLDKLQRQGRVSASDIAFLHPSGRRSICDFSGSRTTNGDAELLVAILHDMTEHKRTEQRLRASEAQLAHAQQVARLGSWERDLATNAVTWSDELYRLFGLEARQGVLEPSFETFIDRVHPDDREQIGGVVARAIQTGDPFTADFRIIRPDGAMRLIHARCDVQADAEGVRMRGTAQDVTEQKQLEQQFYQAQKMEAVGQLAGGVAHDFNNLLTVISGYTAMLLEELDVGDARRTDLEEIENAALRAAALTSQLLAFSRKQVMQPKVIDLNEVVAGVERMLRRLIGEDIELITKLGQGLGPINADPGQLEQVIVNLVVNARDAMPEGGRVVVETESVHVSDDLANRRMNVAAGPYMMLAVSDTGCGMTQETAAQIFEPFFTTKPRDKGTGLGLSTVYGIVRQSGGDIQVFTEPGQGTTFRIYLPRAEGTGSVGPAAPAGRAGVEGSETILLVEDDGALRALSRKILQAKGYQVLEAENGEAALAICERHEGPIHMIATDVVMPGMSGRVLVERLTSKRPGLRMLFMSGYTDDDVLRRGITHPGTAYLQKPFTPDVLARTVREVLDGAPDGVAAPPGPLAAPPPRRRGPTGAKT